MRSGWTNASGALPGKAEDPIPHCAQLLPVAFLSPNQRNARASGFPDHETGFPAGLGNCVGSPTV
ncbi:hypothetical protein N9131_00160 [bacterium]|nr:hypothetical protein [bacterium]